LEKKISIEGENIYIYIHIYVKHSWNTMSIENYNVLEMSIGEEKNRTCLYVTYIWGIILCLLGAKQ